MDVMTSITLRTLSLVLTVALLTLASGTEAATIYVNAKAKGRAAPDGMSWQTAFANLQDALDKAASTPGSDEIWIAEGTYVPTKIYAPNGVVGGVSGLQTTHLNTFDLPDQVAIYGGFAGDERSRSHRSRELHRTVLSGDGVSWHVVTAGNDVAHTGVRATLDGLTIRDGHAQGPAGDLFFAPFSYGHNLGGGLYVAFDSAIDVNDVDFEDNAAGGDGGGMFSINSTLRIAGTHFSHNTAGFRGGALEVFNTYETSPHTASISRSVFENNTAQVFGGAIVGEGTLPDENSSLDINESTFERNTADVEGGAIVFDSQLTSVRNSRFESNVATVTAGALATTNAVDTIVNATFFGASHVFTKFGTTIRHCEFTNNVARGDQAAHDAASGGPAAGVNFALGGGALVAYMNGYLNVVDSSFRDNIAEHGDGGAILNGRSEGKNILSSGADAFDVATTIVNGAFIGNEVLTGNGGAIASLPGSLLNIPERTIANTTLSVTSSTFHANSARGDGGAIYLAASTATLDANTYAGNEAALGNSICAIGALVNGSLTSSSCSQRSGEGR
jgi:predicted outer membrane repeat protein